jgi:hypothetical protein
MRIFNFRSRKSASVFGFTEDRSGAKFSPEHAPGAARRQSEVRWA